MNYKQKLLIELFQHISCLQLSKDQMPHIVVSCQYCKTLIYINFHCKRCNSVYYCDISCLKNDKVGFLRQPLHEQDCDLLSKPTPSLFCPLQIELHSGSDLGQDIVIRYEDEQRLTLRFRGESFIDNFYTHLKNYDWFSKNDYDIQLSLSNEQHGANPQGLLLTQDP